MPTFPREMDACYIVALVPTVSSWDMCGSSLLRVLKGRVRGVGRAHQELAEPCHVSHQPCYPVQLRRSPHSS